MNFSRYIKTGKRISLSSLFIGLFFLTCSFSFINNAYYSGNGDGDLPNWALMDPEKDGYEGTSTLALYQYLAMKDFQPERKKVIVAIIDSGFDINHPDLKDNIWDNTAEINGQPGVDDDANGYVDDLHGWNFLGDTKYLPLEVTREYYRLKKENISESDPYFKKVKDEFQREKNEAKANLTQAEPLLKNYMEAEETLAKRSYSTDPEALKKLIPKLDGEYLDAANYIVLLNSWGIDKEDLEEEVNGDKVKSQLFSESSVNEAMSSIGDNPENLSEKGYGSNNLFVEGELHGTHVAGIIGSKKEGIGQAPFATLMLLRAVPNEGDERDKDIGNAIRYAVDNGAQIINMSAGKYFSRYPDYVIDAIKYAEEKGVLFVNSAGNESADIEETLSYPAKFYKEGGEMKYFSNVIVVGASTWMKKWNKDKDPDDLASNYDLAALFSNYSGKVVDVFAPGVEINSTVPGGKYKTISGTSMASPEVAGVAAVLKAYFPNLTAAQLKEVISSSSRKYEGLNVKLPGGSNKVPFSNLSKSGGVVDLLNAFKTAEQLSSN